MTPASCPRWKPAARSGSSQRAAPDTPTLSVVRRFIDPDGTRRTWEEHAAAGLRIGDEAAANEYVKRGRVHAGDRDTMTDAAYTAWLADTRTGARSLLIAADNDTVRELNERARADLVAAGTVDDTQHRRSCATG